MVVVEAAVSTAALPRGMGRMFIAAFLLLLEGGGVRLYVLLPAVLSNGAAAAWRVGPSNAMTSSAERTLAEDTDEGTQVVVISLGDDDVIGGLLSESDIIARVQAARRKAAHARGGGGSSGGKGEEAAGEADEAEDAAAGGEAGGAAEAADEGAVVDELCQKLRVSLSTMGFSAQWQHLDLLDVLRAELAEAVALDKNAVQAQLQASLRSLATLPATALGPGGSNILEQMHRQYRERQPYISYLVATRQSLIISREQIQKSIAHLEQSISVCTKFFSMTRVRRFLDSRMSSVSKSTPAQVPLLHLLEEDPGGVRGGGASNGTFAGQHAC